MLDRCLMKKIYDALFGKFGAVEVMVLDSSPCTSELEFIVILYNSSHDYSEFGKDVWIGPSKTLMAQLRVKMHEDAFKRDLGLFCSVEPTHWWQPTCWWHILPRDGADEVKASIGEAVVAAVKQWEPKTTWIASGNGKELIAMASSLEELLVQSDLRSR